MKKFLILSFFALCFLHSEAQNSKSESFMGSINVGDMPLGMGVTYEHFFEKGFSGIVGAGLNTIGFVGGIGAKKYFKESRINTGYVSTTIELNSGKGDVYYQFLHNNSELFVSLSVVPGYSFRISKNGKFVGNAGLGISLFLNNSALLAEMYSLTQGVIMVAGDISVSYRF